VYQQHVKEYRGHSKENTVLIGINKRNHIDISNEMVYSPIGKIYEENGENQVKKGCF
jgi:hypothetical protein